MLYYNLNNQSGVVGAGSSLVQSLKRDKSTFEQNGVSSEMIDAFTAKFNQFHADVKEDESALMLQKMYTEQKDWKREALYTLVRKWFLRLEGVGKQSQLYRHLHIAGLNDNTDVEFTRLVGVLVTNIEARKDELVAEWVPVDMLADWEARRLELIDMIGGMRYKRKNRNFETQERHELMDELVVEINRFRSVGKSIWLGVNEAYYNDYLLTR